GNRILISGNSAEIFGGGLDNNGSGQVTLTNSTISGNTAGDDAGGIYNNDNNTGGATNKVQLTNVTITANHANSDAGGIDNYGGSNGATGIIFQNTIIAGNTNDAAPPSPDCRNPFNHPYNSLGNNLIGNRNSCTFTAQSSDIVGDNSAPIDPRLAPLAD